MDLISINIKNRNSWNIPWNVCFQSLFFPFFLLSKCVWWKRHAWTALLSLVKIHKICSVSFVMPLLFVKHRKYLYFAVVVFFSFSFEFCSLFAILFFSCFDYTIEWQMKSESFKRKSIETIQLCWFEFFSFSFLVSLNFVRFYF